MDKDIWKRFWSKVTVKTPEECWEWQANLGRGYGMFWFGKRCMVAHRVSWTMLRRPIPEGKLVLHKCDNRKCVNPNHLFIGTQSDNVQDMLQKGRAGDSRRKDMRKFNLCDSERISHLIDVGVSFREIAKMYDTTHQTIQRAISDGRIQIV